MACTTMSEIEHIRLRINPCLLETGSEILYPRALDEF